MWCVLIPRCSLSTFQISDVNWAPLSDVRCNGTPNLAIQFNNKALAHVSVKVSVMGIASGHLVKRSTIVKRYRNPCDSGSGPTMSTFMCSKRDRGTSKISCGALTWVWILAVWQLTHCLAINPTSLRMLCQTNLDVTNFCDDRTDGCDKLWIASKTRLQKERGTNGRGWPRLTSHKRVSPVGLKGTSTRRRLVSVVRRAVTSGSTRCAEAISE